MRYVFLSFILDDPTPGYGQSVAIRTVPQKCISRGDSSNTAEFTMLNHLGTHLDAPAHFSSGAISPADLPPSAFVFNHPAIVDVPAQPGQLIRREDLPAIPSATDLLVIRTGFGRHRGQPVYSQQNPGIAPGLGHWLRSNRPTVRAIGFDFISLSSYQHRSTGREAHRVFLDPVQPILVIEDMDLSPDLTGLRRIIVLPLRIRGLDSAPCTVIAECA